MNTVDKVRSLVLPLLDAASVQLYDIEHESGILRIMLDREGGIDVDTIGDMTQQISDALDREDPVPDSKYLLEVTSPGIERKLRTPAHYAAVVGEKINVKLREATDEGERRFEAVLLSADEKGFELAVEGAESKRIAYQDVEAARTVFDWVEELAEKKKAAKQEKSPKPNKKKAS